MLKAERTGASLTELAIGWKGCPNIDHYTVTVFNGSKDLSPGRDAITPLLCGRRPRECTRWQVRAAVDADGNTVRRTPTAYTLAPGGVSGMDVGPDDRRHQRRVFWNAPASRAPDPLDLPGES